MVGEPQQVNHFSTEIIPNYHGKINAAAGHVHRVISSCDVFFLPLYFCVDNPISLCYHSRVDSKKIEVYRSMHDDSTLMTEGSISKKIIRFALPVFWGNLFQQLYNVVDSLVVGNFIGSQALAAVGSSGSLTFLLVGLVNGIFLGAGVVVSRYVGARDDENISRAVHTTVAFGLICGLLLTLVGVTLTPSILRLMGTPDDVLPTSITYLRIYFIGVLASVMYNVSNGIFNAVGDSKHPLYFLILSSAINVVLDLLFVAVLQWGIAGAAWATVISQAVSAFLGLRLLCHVTDPWRLFPKRISLHRTTLMEILKLGVPSGLQNSIISLANTVVQSNINAFGSVAMAGCSAYSKIEGFAFLPITSFAMAMSTFIGQNLGAKQYDRAKKGARFGIVCCIILSELIGIIFYAFAPILIGAFDSDPSVIAVGVQQARTITLFYFLLAFSHGAAGVLRGAGKSTVPMFVMLGCWCIIRITYLVIMVPLFREMQTIFWVYPFTWSLSTVCFTIYYLKADWIHGYEKP